MNSTRGCLLRPMNACHPRVTVSRITQNTSDMRMRKATISHGLAGASSRKKPGRNPQRPYAATAKTSPVP